MLIAMMMMMMLAGAGQAAPAPVAVHATTRYLTLSIRDYPREARAKGETGRAVFRYLIDATGQARDCEIVKSSGSAALDLKSCQIVTRSRFRPARDAQGNPVAEYWRWAIDWRNPKAPSILADDPMPEAASPSEPGVAVGTANWETMPVLGENAQVRRKAASLHAAVDSLIERRECVFGSRSSDQYRDSGDYRIDIHYALRLTPEGKVERVLIEDKGCRPLELLITSMVLEKEFLAGIEPPGGTATRWYKSMLRFSRR